jgi:hypothetical protein
MNSDVKLFSYIVKSNKINKQHYTCGLWVCLWIMKMAWLVRFSKKYKNAGNVVLVSS